MLRPALHGRLQLLRVFDHGHDLFKSGGTGNRLHPDVQLSFLDHSSGIDGLPWHSSHRHGLAGKGNLIYHAFPAGYLSVKGDHISHMYGHHIAFPDLIRLYQDLLPVPFQPDFFNIQGHAPRQVSHGLFMGPLFQKFSHPQQEHDRTGGIKVPAQDGDPDGSRIQKRDFDLPLPDAAQPRRKISKRLKRHDPCAQGRRHQEPSAVVQQHFRDQFFLIGCVQFPSGIADNGFRNRCIFIPEALQQTDQRGTLPCITDDSVCGAFIHFHICYIALPVQIPEKNVRLRTCHFSLNDMDAETAPDLMLYDKFHERCVVPSSERSAPSSSVSCTAAAS